MPDKVPYRQKGFVAFLYALFCLVALSREAQAALRPADALSPVSPAQVLVVANTDSPDSLVIAEYYLRKRHVPRANLCRITCATAEECATADFETRIRMPVWAALKQRPRIDYILLTRGIPIRVHEDGSSVDSLLALPPARAKERHVANPYFDKAERFTHTYYGFYLVTRLEGYTRADCLALVDHSLAAQPLPGPFLLHTGTGHEEAGYRHVNDGMRQGSARLLRKGFHAELSTGETFPGDRKGLMGYFSWGSNDTHWDKKAYRSLRFAPGAIAETAVSTSGRTFADPNAPGQSLIADLIAQGVTGCKGYVAEPFSNAIARAEVLFDRYTSGFTLGESFFMASLFLGWKDVVIGDPLCAPYAVHH